MRGGMEKWRERGNSEQEQIGGMVSGNRKVAMEGGRDG
jgi:hypothetical protein